MRNTLIGRLGQWNGRVTWWLARIAAVALAFLAFITFADVIARYFFNSPFSFTVEVTEILMGLMIYFGVGLTTHDNDHIAVDFVTLRLSEWMRVILGLLMNVLAFGFLVLMVWRLWLRAADLLEKGDVSPVMQYPRWPTAFIMAIGAIFFLTGILVHILFACRRLSTGDVSSPPPAATSRPYTD
jgi:TRAP-type C4-dicarboxylate transport system permease small subunit